MKILVFGAAGPTGHHVVEMALRQGFEVTAFLHDHHKISEFRPHLRVLRGSIHDLRAVQYAMRHQDAVICAIELTHNGHTTLLSEGTANIIRAMHSHRVKRLVCVSSLGVLGSDAGFLHKKIIIPLFHKHAFADMRRQVEEIMRSDLEWTVVRTTRRTSTARKHKYHVSFVRPIGSAIPRVNVADFMLKLVKSNRFMREMPIISS